MRRIYIASSWKCEDKCLSLAKRLRAAGHEVDLFCDPSTGRYSFHWSQMVDKEEDLMEYDAISFLADERSHKAFLTDKEKLDWSNTVLLVLPSGKSAHLEAGYGVGSGKSLVIYGPLLKGEFDVMYGFADAIIREGGYYTEEESFNELLHVLDDIDAEFNRELEKARKEWNEKYKYTNTSE